MLLKFFVDYPHVVYAIIAWGYIFAFIRLKGIKRLWPMSIFGSCFLFGATYWLTTIGLYKFNEIFMPIMGIPLFYIIWGAASGLIFAYYLGEKLVHRLIAILAFSGIVVFMENFVEDINGAEHLGKFNIIYEYTFDVMVLATFAFLITNLFKRRLSVKR